jgi:hypothetical protein
VPKRWQCWLLAFNDKASTLDACESGSLMRNDEIAEILDEIADMLELRDDNFYHKRAYRLAAEGVRDFPQPIELLPRDQLQKIRGMVPTWLQSWRPCWRRASSRCSKSCEKRRCG